MPFSVKYSPILIVDIGNTNIVCAVFANGEPEATYRFRTNALCSVGDYHDQFRAALPGYCDFAYVALASVVPEVGKCIKVMFACHSSAEVYEINGLSELGLSYVTENPAQIGADLVANAFAAWKLYDTSTLVVDLGTATTIQLITKFGLYAGVAIAPGLKTAAAHLIEEAAQLSDVVLVAPDFVLGNNTQDAMLAGIVRGHALMIQAFVEEIRAEYAQYAPYQVILTGGLSSLVAKLLPSDYRVNAQLTLHGLYLALLHLAGQESLN